MLKRIPLASPALLLVLAGSVLASDPPRLLLEPPAALPSPPVAKKVGANQQHADAVALQIDSSKLLKNFHINVTCTDGVVELDGYVRDTGQRDEAVRLASSVPGVEKVVSRLTVVEVVDVKRAQFAMQDEPAPTPRAVPGSPAMQEPLPSFRAAPSAYGMGAPPPLPPYAWPTYAPYNNYSRVGYPVSYPYEAFPFIGPVHPFPKAPLGWRKVVLSFDDGHWWLSTHAQKRDWWVLKYW